MTVPDPEHIRELLVPYSLRVLSDEETELVRAALDQSAALRAELAEIEEASAALVSGSVAPEVAPAFIKSRVMDAIGAADHASASTRRHADRRPRWQVLLPTCLAAGFAGACAVLAIVSISLNRDLDDANRAAERANERASSIPADMSLAKVSTSGALQPASGQLIRIASHRYVLLLHDVPSPGAGSSWQVWTADSTGAIANVGQWVDGSSTQAILVSSDDVRQIMVSHEPTLRAMARPGSAAVAEVTI